MIKFKNKQRIFPVSKNTVFNQKNTNLFEIEFQKPKSATEKYMDSIDKTVKLKNKKD